MRHEPNVASPGPYLFALDGVIAALHDIVHGPGAVKGHEPESSRPLRVVIEHDLAIHNAAKSIEILPEVPIIHRRRQPCP